MMPLSPAFTTLFALLSNDFNAYAYCTRKIWHYDLGAEFPAPEILTHEVRKSDALAPGQAREQTEK